MLAAPVSRAAGNRPTPVSNLSPIAAPMNSAKSVAIATSSAWIQSSTLTGEPNRSRHNSARFRPVATPSFALIVWISAAIRFAVTTTHSNR